MLKESSILATDSKRIFPRAEGEFPAWYQLAGGAYQRSVALDIGATGACLLATEPLEVGTTLEIGMQLEPDWLVRADATVVWCEPREDYFILGVRHKPLRSADRSLMGPWIHKQRRA